MTLPCRPFPFAETFPAHATFPHSTVAIVAAAAGGLPPARGRTGFAVKPFGLFEQFDIAPTDGLAGRPGTWTIDRGTHLRIHLTDGQEPDYTLEILDLDTAKQVLKVRRLP